MERIHHGSPGDACANTIDFCGRLSSAGNARQDFGDLSSSSVLVVVSWDMSNQTRACKIGGSNRTASPNTMDYVQIAATGNAIDFGDQLVIGRGTGMSNHQLVRIHGGDTSSKLSIN